MYDFRDVKWPAVSHDETVSFKLSICARVAFGKAYELWCGVYISTGLELFSGHEISSEEMVQIERL